MNVDIPSKRDHLNIMSIYVNLFKLIWHIHIVEKLLCDSVKCVPTAANKPYVIDRHI